MIFEKYLEISETTVAADVAAPDVKIGDNVCPITGKKKKKLKIKRELRKRLYKALD